MAVIDESGPVGYRELHRRSLRLAAGLRAAGVRAGDVVAVNLPNGWRACAADFALAALGAISLPYPVGRKRRETLSLLRRSRAVAAIVTRYVGELDYVGLLAELRPELPALKSVLVHGEVAPGTQSLDAMCDSSHDAIPLGDLPEVSPDAPARIMASSGSEAEPKLVLYSHNALVSGQTPYLTTLGDAADGTPPRFLFCVPLSSPFGSFGTPCILAAMGASLVTLNRFEPDAVLDAVARHRPSHLLVSPAMLEQLVASPLLSGPDRIDTDSVTAIVCGGANVHTDTVKRTQDSFDATFVHSYGSADGIACHTALDDSFDDIVGSVGKPDPRVISVRIADDDGNDVGFGVAGELYARGPMTPLCYYNSPELDERYRLDGGWTKTGDIAVLDADGRLHVTGRKKDVINKGGVKVSVAELEEVLHQHPSVRSAAVLGMPDGPVGERIVACVVLHRDAAPLDLDLLRAYLRDEIGLETAKFPERLLTLAEFPLTPAGKVDKSQLRSAVSA
ncbi:Long-chain-fatty-acid--CoA ligase [Amycolatopsis azurea DSM 43854]|uniref:Long-chain-fatty-acid--CoA ligase n=1 Tax=Amycolatopsis azurea DSM 43854 TaxID=1238180 RepID=M2P2E3_9PSEU|nr:Long-chain-fatty-acid--CoA ligase [Amycolatopsis azurea DSM 43854]